MGTVSAQTFPDPAMMKAALVLSLLGCAAASPVPQLGALKGLLESLSGDESPGEVNGDYQEVPYETIQKLNGYEERRYPSVKWACTEATYDIEEENEEDEEGSEEWNLVKMMQMMTNKKSWKKKPQNQMFMKLFRYISGVNKERVVFVKQFGGYAMKDSVWAKEALKFAEELSDRADEVEFSPYLTAGYDSPMKFWNRRNEVMFIKTDQTLDVEIETNI